MSILTDEEIDKIQEIVNSIPDYFDDPEEIQCPHCGETQGFESGEPGMYNEDGWEHKCFECGKTFSICGSMSWNWSTETKSDE